MQAAHRAQGKNFAAAPAARWSSDALPSRAATAARRRLNAIDHGDPIAADAALTNF
jgi:hypothetical protein